MRQRKLGYRAKHLFSISRAPLLGLEHFLAMLPATILVPIMINGMAGDGIEIIDVSLVLLTSGVGTLVYLICQKNPGYLGSSFAFIGFTVTMIVNLNERGVDKVTAFHYICYSYAFVGLILIAFSFLMSVKRFEMEKRLKKWLPVAVLGPAISLIGLELAQATVLNTENSEYGINYQQMNGSELIVVAVTFLAIVFLSVFMWKISKSIAIIGGTAIGCIVVLVWHGYPISFETLRQAPTFVVPNFSNAVFGSWPVPDLGFLLVNVIPVALVLFAENISRVTVTHNMRNRDEDGEYLHSPQLVKEYSGSLLRNGVAVIGSALVGSVPNTVYAENIAVMNIHSYGTKNIDQNDDKYVVALHQPWSKAPLIFAAAYAIVVAFIGPVQQFLINLPKPVVGGMELFLFGLIATPGIQLLIREKVDYRKVTNQLLTASVLIAGISGLSINIGFVELEGMRLGLTIGIMLNAIFRGFAFVGLLYETYNCQEIFQMVGEYFNDMKVSEHLSNAEKVLNQQQIDELMSDKVVPVKHLTLEKDGEMIDIEQLQSQVKVTMKHYVFDAEKKAKLKNEYLDFVYAPDSGDIEISLRHNVSRRRFVRALKQIKEAVGATMEDDPFDNAS